MDELLINSEDTSMKASIRSECYVDFKFHRIFDRLLPCQGKGCEHCSHAVEMHRVWYALASPCWDPKSYVLPINCKGKKAIDDFRVRNEFAGMLLMVHKAEGDWILSHDVTPFGYNGYWDIVYTEDYVRAVVTRLLWKTLQ